MPAGFIQQRVCFLPYRHADCKDHQRCRLGINVNVKNSSKALIHDLQLHHRLPSCCGLEDHSQRRPNACHPIQLAPTSTSTEVPTYPTLQSPQIRFNQTTCAVWLGVRKRIISKQRSYSPGFIGIRTGLLCRI